MKKEISALEVIVVGAGALGNAVVWNLGTRGVGRVLCVDPDHIEAANLALARLFHPGIVGQPKASSLVAEAAARFPASEWMAFDGEIADLGWGRIEGADLILSCVDRDSARLEIARISTRLGIPVCDGGLGVAGRVSYFPSTPDQACFGCRLTAARRRELLCTWRSQAFPCTEPTTETARVSTIEQVEATGAMQVELGLSGGSAITTEIRASGVTRFEMSVSEGCPFHELAEASPPLRSGFVRAHSGTNPDREGGDLVAFPEELLPGMVCSWEWPICLIARCQSCQTEWRPLMRRARLRACPACGSERILALECVDQISASSRLTPESIGLPEDHRYTVRVMPVEEL